MALNAEIDIDGINELLAALDDKNIVINLFKNLAEDFSTTISTALLVTTADRNTSNSPNVIHRANELNNKLATAYKIVKNADTFNISIELEKLKSTLDIYDAKLSDKNNELFKPLNNQINEFFTIYKAIDKSTNFNGSNELQIEVTANNIYTTIITIRKSLLATLATGAKLLKDLELKPNEDLFTLVIEEKPEKELNFKDIAEIFDAFTNLYTILCEVTGISITEFPLKVVRIESGCISIIATGSSAIFLLISLILVGAFITTLSNPELLKIILSALPNIIKTITDKHPHATISKIEKGIETQKDKIFENAKRTTDKGYKAKINGKIYEKESYSQETYEKTLNNILKETAQLPPKNSKQRLLDR